jgi:hypothetical protein
MDLESTFLPSFFDAVLLCAEEGKLSAKRWVGICVLDSWV